jgi:thiol-disulfide isomerase/thioredoxin
MKRGHLLLLLTLALVVAGLIWLTSLLSSPGTDHLPTFALSDLEQRSRNSDEWRGKVLVINFWATWCPPCLEELPRFTKFQQRYGAQGLQVVAVAIDDLAPVRELAARTHFNFPVLVGGEDAIALSKQMGNRILALPYTAIFDRSGTLRHTSAGAISESELEEKLQPLL